MAVRASCGGMYTGLWEPFEYFVVFALNFLIYSFLNTKFILRSIFIPFRPAC